VYGMSPRRNWDSPDPSPVSECAFPPGPKGGGAHCLRLKGWGSSNSDDWRKSLAFCLLCDLHKLHSIYFTAKESSEPYNLSYLVEISSPLGPMLQKKGRNFTFLRAVSSNTNSKSWSSEDQKVRKKPTVLFLNFW
jgi:hypothetical protein